MNRKNIVVLIAGMFLVSTGYTMVIPFLPLYLLQLGVNSESIGFWTGISFSICFFIAGVMGPVWGKLSDSMGKKKMAIRAAILICISYILCGLCQNEYQFLVVRAFQGIANGFIAASMAIIAESAAVEKLGTTLGFAQTSLAVGGICGPLLGGIMAHVAGMRNTFFLSAFFLFFVCVAVIFYVKEPKIHEERETKPEDHTTLADDVKYGIKNRRLRELLGITFLLQCTLLMIQPVTSLYVAELLGSMEHVELISGIIVSMGGVAGAITTVYWGRFGQEKGYYKAMMLISLGAGCMLLLQSLPREIFLFALFQFLSSCFIVGMHPSLNAALVTYTPERFHGRVFGLSTAAQQFGNMTGPLLAAAWMAISLRSVYVIAGLLQLLLAYIMYRNHISKHDFGK